MNKNHRDNQINDIENLEEFLVQKATGNSGGNQASGASGNSA